MKKLIEKVKNIIFKKKIKKDPQRLKHKVRFSIEYNCEAKDAHKSKPTIAFVEAGGISEKKFFIGDVVKSINGIKVKTADNLDNEINKLNWGDEVFFEVERDNKIEKVNIKTISFEHYKENCITWGIGIEKVGKLIKIESVGIEYNINHEIDVGDTPIAINSEKISSMEDFDRERSKYKVGDNIKYKIQKTKERKPIIVNIKLISSDEAIKINKKSCEDNLAKTTGTLLFKEWEESDYGYNHEDWMKRRDEIVKLDSIAERFSESVTNNDVIRKWKNSDAKLINKLVKPQYKDINFKLNFYSLIFNSKIIEKLKSISLKNECCYSFILTGKAQGGDWNKEVPENVSNFEKLVSVKDKSKELLFDKISEATKSYFFNLMIDKKKDLKIKYISKKKNKSEEKLAVLTTNRCFEFKSITDLLSDWFEDKCKFNKAKTKLAINEWCKSFFLEYPDFTLERLKEIKKMDLEDEPEEEDYTDDDYSEDEGYDEKKIYITTTVKKEKVVGKESFVLTLNGLPDDEKLETLRDGKKIFLKIYIFDVTDLESNKYYEILDTTGLTDQYFSNHCYVIKTNEVTWSDENMNLIQSKELEPYGDHPTELAFPYSVMQLPKVGKRKLSFRTFLCTNKQKFDDVEGRPKDGESINYRPESFKMDDDGEYGFDDYGDYSEILSYASSEIEVEYKQPGYLDINRRKYNDLTIALGLALNQQEGKNLKENFEKIKDEIRYDGDSSAEGNIYKSLSLKSNYESALKKKIDLESILKELKKNSRIHERYEMIDLLLNLAITDETYSAKENEFIDKVAKSLDLHNEQFQEIKKRKTASVKFVDFGDKADESIFGITKDMDKKEKLKVLRKEYSRWNALTNNNDKAIRERAREMRDLAANTRRQYT